MNILQRVVKNCAWLLLPLLFLNLNQTQASHLMGGNLSYEYLGLNGTTGNYDYRVTLNIYRLCDPGSSLLPGTMLLGAYQDNPGNPGGNKILLSDISMPLISQQFITPPNANDSCTFLPSVCVEEGIYQGIISVPANATGYYFIADRCCRNNNIANLDNAGGTGQAYYAQVPPPTIINNAPTFAVAPVPFLCAGDTVSVLNQAFDADGDLLIYNFVTPFGGISTNGNPNPGPPVSYTWPIPDVTYAFGYSAASPFGTGGYINIDTTTGLASYVAPNQGFYVVAVEIKEYRNGVLIGVTRRDIQLIIIACPVNPAPNLAPGSTTTTFTIQEGETLCFNVAFSDANGDSLFLSRNGDIFNPLITIPPATLTATSGIGTISSQFCWNTACGQGRSTPYQFSAVVVDNGCPAKTTNIVYTINVTPAQQPAIINGPDTLCLNTANGIGYTVSTTAGYTYNWLISNGSQASGGTTGSIGVNFSTNGIATVSVIAVNPFGCPADTVSKTVFIRNLPAAVAGSDVSFCSGGSAVLGGSSTAGVSYSWSPATGLNNTTISNPTVTVTNGTGSPQSTTYILTTTLNGCINSDTVVVTTNPFPVANAGNNISICSGSSAPLGALPTAGFTYSWAPSTGISNPGIANPVLTLSTTNLTPDTLLYAVIVQNSFGCNDSDTVQVIVRPLPTANAGNDISFCSGASGTIGSALTTNYTYSWNPASGLSNSTGSTTSVTLTNSSTTNDTIPYIITTTLFGCIDRDTVNVIVRPIPTANAGSNQLLCSGNTINLGTSTTSGYNYSWSPSTGLSNTTISNPTLNLNIDSSATDPDTLFYVVVTTLNGCTNRDTVQIILSPVPVAAAGSDVIFCSGQSVAIGTAPVSGYTYTWSPAQGISSTSSAQPNLTLTNTGTTFDTSSYVMTVNWFGCIDRDTIQAIVKPLPISEAGANTGLCNGDTLTLGTSATAGYTYSWTPGTGLSSTTSSSPLLTVSNPGPGILTQTYTVNTLWNGCGSSDSVTITINPLPVVTATASANPICAGSGTTLNASGAGTYNWALSSAPGTSIGTGSGLNVSPTVSTTYLVTGTSSANCTNTSSVTVTVIPLPSVAITAVNDTICDGDTITLNAGGASTYTWSVSGTTIGSGPTISVSPSVNTTYVLSGTDANNCSNTDTIDIAINPAATVSTIIGSISLCPGVTGVQYWVLNPNPTSTYNWSINNGILQSGQGGDTVTVDWDSAGVGSITVIETTDRGCQSDPVVLNVSINIILTPAAPSGPTTLCANQAQGQIYTNLNTPGSVYNWFANGGNITGGNGTGSVTVDWTTAGPATVALWYEETSTTVDTVCFGISDTIYVTINPVPATGAITGNPSICESDTGNFSVINTTGSTYQWTNSGGSIVSGNGTSTISANWNTSGTTTISVTETNSFGCTGTPVTYTLTVNPLPNASAGSDNSICIGDSTTLSASGGISYQWSPATGLDNAGIANPIANPTTTTTYTVLVTDGNGCKNTDDVTVFVNPLPIVSAGGDVDICIGSSIQLNATGGSMYSWSPSTGLDNPSVPTPTANPVSTITYTVFVTDTNGCNSSDQVVVTVNPLPTAQTGPDTLLCNGSSILLQASGGVSYQWSPVTGLNNPSIANPVASPGAPTTYTVTVTDINGCTDEDDLFISINAQPEALFELDTTFTRFNCEGIRIKTINLSTDALDYQWTFGDGNSSTAFEPSYLYPFGTSINLTLIATNNQCTDTLLLPVQFDELAEYIKGLPNSFSPNGDDLNECFDLRKKLNFTDCSTWYVYNRWGEMVFKSTTAQHCWNGRKDSNGEFCPTGTYFYVLKIGDATFNGSITLFR